MAFKLISPVEIMELQRKKEQIEKTAKEQEAKSKELTEKEKTLARGTEQLQKEYEIKSKELDIKSRELDKKEKDLSDTEYKLSSVKRDLEKKDAELKEKSSVLDKREDDVTKREKEIKEKDAEVIKREKEVEVNKIALESERSKLSKVYDEEVARLKESYAKELSTQVDANKKIIERDYATKYDTEIKSRTAELEKAYGIKLSSEVSRIDTEKAKSLEEEKKKLKGSSDAELEIRKKELEKSNADTLKLKASELETSFKKSYNEQLEEAKQEIKKIPSDIISVHQETTRTWYLYGYGCIFTPTSKHLRRAEILGSSRNPENAKDYATITKMVMELYEVGDNNLPTGSLLAKSKEYNITWGDRYWGNDIFYDNLDLNKRYVVIAKRVSGHTPVFYPQFKGTNPFPPIISRDGKTWSYEGGYKPNWGSAKVYMYNLVEEVPDWYRASYEKRLALSKSELEEEKKKDKEQLDAYIKKLDIDYSTKLNVETNKIQGDYNTKAISLGKSYSDEIAKINATIDEQVKKGVDERYKRYVEPLQASLDANVMQTSKYMATAKTEISKAEEATKTATANAQRLDAMITKGLATTTAAAKEAEAAYKTAYAKQISDFEQAKKDYDIKLTDGIAKGVEEGLKPKIKELETAISAANAAKTQLGAAIKMGSIIQKTERV